jgi:hypothetical protein
MNKTVIGALAIACAVLAPAAGAERETESDALIAAAVVSGTEAQARAVIARAEKSAPSCAALVTGITRHNLAVENPARWAAAAVEALEKCAKTGDPIALGYYGSALTISAGLLSGKGDVAGATAAVREGFAKMDQAVKAAPGSRLLRFLRAENAGDMARIETIRGRIALGKGDPAEAMRRFEAAIRTAPESPAAAAARKIMEDFEE